MFRAGERKVGDGSWLPSRESNTEASCKEPVLHVLILLYIRKKRKRGICTVLVPMWIPALLSGGSTVLKFTLQQEERKGKAATAASFPKCLFAGRSYLPATLDRLSVSVCKPL